MPVISYFEGISNMKKIQLEGYAITHEGKIRENNEDNFFLFEKIKEDVNEKQMSFSKVTDAENAVAAVYDGMGGETAGEQASLTAAQYAEPYPMEQIAQKAREQILSANNDVCEKIQECGSRMGTTAVQVYFGDGKACCVNIGDSRCYLFREGQLKQLSKDHSEGQQMIDMGIKTEEEARKSMNWHKLTQHIGIFPEEFTIQPFISEQIDLLDGDIFLLCSDGLTDMVEDTQICYVLKNAGEKGISLKETAEELLQKALINGGKDNTTIVLVRVNVKEGSSSDENVNTDKLQEKDNDTKKSLLSGVLGGIAVLLLIGLLVWYISEKTNLGAKEIELDVTASDQQISEVGFGE